MRSKLLFACLALFALLFTACASTAPRIGSAAAPGLRIDAATKGCTFKIDGDSVLYDRAVILEDLNADEVKVLLPDRNGWDPRLWVNMLKTQVLRVGQYLISQGRRCMCPPGLWGSLNPTAADR